jgi:DNA-3-methyladenine glycosylase
MNCQHSSFYQRPTEVVARDLVGKKLVRIIGKNRMRLRLAGIIVETEAYGYSDDPASHAYNGATARNKAMFGDVGRAYIYFTYGNHFCLNISARTSNVDAGAVLIRGIEPVEGIELMRQLRPVDDVLSLTSGPGKLTQALKITSALNGTDMTSSDSELYIEYGRRPKHILTTPRMGITRAVDKEWRFVNPSSFFVSRRFKTKSSSSSSSPLPQS